MKKAKKNSPPGPPTNTVTVTIDELILGWNDELVPLGFGKVKPPLSSSRRQKVLARIIEHPDRDFWEGVFQAVARSKFLRGGTTSRSWKLTFDWLFTNDSNAEKVSEGQYP